MDQRSTTGRRLPRLSTIVACLALFVALGGTATAAGLLNGKKIKPGTITAKQLKNRSVTLAKLAPATVDALRGATGATGPAGAPGQAGPTGPAGAPGSDGLVAPLTDVANDLSLPNDEQIEPLAIDGLAAGQYLLMAKATVVSHRSAGSNDINCAIWTDDVSGEDEALATLEFNEAATLSMMSVSTVQSKVSLRCWSMSGSGYADDLKLIVTPVTAAVR